MDNVFASNIPEGSGSKKRRKDLSKKSDSTKPVFLDVRREVEFNGMGNFEKHTKGVGMKLLEKWGYRGGGLGKNEQGIVTPIETKMLPKYTGIGFSKNKEEPDEKSLSCSSSSIPAEIRPKDKLWSKQASRKRKAYITAEELRLKKQEQGVGFVQQVLDMRGPQVRVLTTLENLYGDEKMPELQHNVKLLVDLSRFDIQKLDRDLRSERETVVALQKENEKLQKDAYFLKQQTDNMEEIVSVLHQIDEKNLVGSLTLESLAKSLMDLQTRYADDCIMCYYLTCIICSYARLLFIRLFQGWDPLQYPTHGVELVSIWKNLLIRDSLKLSGTASPYTQLLMEVVCPAVRKSGINTWQAREPDPMLKFMESWEELLPPPVLQTILDSVILPKLSAAIDSWDPLRKETISVHSWIHPWLPILSSWKAVLDSASWEQLMVQYIIPKLSAVMHEIQVSSANQTLDHFNWVQTWFSIIPTHQMLHLMGIFFNKWQYVLYHWLCSDPNFEEVMKWYLGWKERLTPELLANKHIRYRLNIGLEMMNKAVEGLEVVDPGLTENICYLGVQEQRQLKTQKRTAVEAQQGGSLCLGKGSDDPQMSLKEVIEYHAQQNGLFFKPKAGKRTQDGHPIYSFGNISIKVDTLNQKIFAKTEDIWSLVSLEQLLELHSF